MPIYAGLLSKSWLEVFLTTCYIIIGLFTKTLKGKTTI